MRRLLVTTFALAFGLAAALAPRVARAQASPQASSTDAAKADQLFEQGKAQMAAHHYTAACASFASSQSLDPSEGTLLALGLCHEQDNKLVQAFGELRDVHASAVKSGREDRQRVARSALARIEPRIGRLAIRTEEGAPTCVASLRLDGARLPDTERASEVGVEPGAHVVACTGWTKELSVAAGALEIVVVPHTVQAPAPVPAPLHAGPPRAEPPRPAAPPREERGANTLGWGLTIGGAVTLGVGSAFGLRAFQQWDAVRGKCVPAACTNPSASDDASAARTSALVADIVMPIGVALVAAGVYFLVTHRETHVAAR